MSECGLISEKLLAEISWTKIYLVLEKCKDSQERKLPYILRGNMREIYFTSDLHLGHRGIITMQNRPFQTVEEMNRILIQNFNACVGKGDTVYILGDICHHMPLEAANNTIASLHGKKCLIKGNHDKKYEESLFEEICEYKVVSLNGEMIVLMHYPMMSWLKSRRGSIHLHGHIHADINYNRTNREQGIRRYDVGVDANNFMPISIKQIMQFYSVDKSEG